MEPSYPSCSLLDYINLYRRKLYTLSHRKSPIAGNGIFTEQFIPKDAIILISSDKIKVPESTSYPICGMFNDPDFIYPANFEAETLKETLLNYRQSNKNNIRFVWDKNDFFLVKANRDIYPGEELTRKYGAEKWSMWLMCDICDTNVFNLGKFKFQKEERITHLTTIMKVWRDFGYDIKLNNK